MAATAMRPTTLKIDPDTKARVQRLAEARHRTPHWLLLEAVRQYVEREEKRDAFRQEALQAWNDYHENGQHVTGEEVTAWLETWGDSNEQAAPSCHR